MSWHLREWLLHVEGEFKQVLVVCRSLLTGVQLCLWCEVTCLARVGNASTFTADCYLVRSRLQNVHKAVGCTRTTHTYLDGTSPFKCQGLWTMGILHSTATLSIQRTPMVLYELRLMHRLNIFLSRFGHSGWVGSFFFRSLAILTLTLFTAQLI